MEGSSHSDRKAISSIVPGPAEKEHDRGKSRQIEAMQRQKTTRLDQEMAGQPQWHSDQ